MQGQDENSSLFVNIEKMCKKEEEEEEEEKKLELIFLCVKTFEFVGKHLNFSRRFLLLIITNNESLLFSRFLLQLLVLLADHVSRV